jgi:hypothetical protein
MTDLPTEAEVRELVEKVISWAHAYGAYEQADLRAVREEHKQTLLSAIAKLAQRAQKSVSHDDWYALCNKRDALRLECEVLRKAGDEILSAANAVYVDEQHSERCYQFNKARRGYSEARCICKRDSLLAAIKAYRALRKAEGGVSHDQGRSPATTGW